MTRAHTAKTADLLRALVDLADHGLEVIESTSGRFVDANEASCRELGYSAKDLRALTIFDVEPVATPASFAHLSLTAMTRGESIFETMRQRRDGSTFPVEVTLRRLPGDPALLVSAVRNLTTRRRAEEERQQIAWQHASLINSIDGILWEADAQTLAFRFVSAQAERLLGYPPAAWTSDTNFWRDHLHPDDRDWAVDYCVTRIARGEAHEFEYRMIAADGRVVWLHDVASIVMDGDVPVAARGVMVDVTKRRQAEDALRASEDRLRAILNAEPECVKLLAEDGSLIDINPAGLAMVEADALADVVGKDITGVVRPEHREAFTNLTRDVFAGGTGILEYEIEGFRGTRLWLETHAAPLRDRQGRIIAALSVTRNITDRINADGTRRRLEEQLRQAQKMETIGQLAGGIAHDFNNLLTVIEGHVALLETDSALPESLVEAVHEIGLASQRASSLTRQLLTVSRRQPMTMRDFDLNEVVSHMSRMIGRIVGGHIEVGVTLTEHPLGVHADGAMIDQVLLNLAVNARDAMPDGGKLTIVTSAETFDRSSVPAAGVEPGAFARIEVTDTGTGISDDVLPRVFEPFFTTKDIGKGTGLGLATADGIVRQHGGWMEVRSELGRGSTFTIHLPKTLHKRAVIVATPPVKADLEGTETILIVEDEAPLRALLKQILARAGYDVIEAATGHEALEAWRAHRTRIRLLVTDLMMPDGMSGLDLACRLLNENRDLRIVYTSGYSQEIAGEGRLQDGSSFLAKPYRPKDLLATVREHLDR